MNAPITMTFEGVYPASAARGYRNLPFEVPDGIGRIDITYDCVSDFRSVLLPGENPQDYFADILLFDSRGAGFQGAGYRGTSGNSRTSIFVATDEATPGYSSGPLPPGTWTLTMGFFKVPPSGTQYQVSIRLTEQRPGTPVVLPERLPVRSISTHSINPTGWYKGDLHCHTFHSDGEPSPTEVVREAEQLGLDFLAVTDHNVFTQEKDLMEAETDLILIPGCEVTTSQGHWNIWGDAGWIECRIMTADEMAAAYREAVRQGYLTSLNHPRPGGPPWRLPEVEGNQCVEVWNGVWEDNNTVCLGFWEKKINAGKRLVGGSDCHRLHTPGEGPLAQPTTYIYCEGAPSAAALIAALRAGHAFVTRDPNGPQLFLTSGSAMMGDAAPRPAAGRLALTVRVVDGDSALLELWTSAGQVVTQPVDGSDVSYAFDVEAAATPYVRAQLRDPESGSMLAITNPIYFDD